MSNKLFGKVVLSALACLAIGLVARHVSARCNPSMSVLHGEGSYTTTSLGIPFDVEFEFDLREQNGVDKGWIYGKTWATPGVGFDPGFESHAKAHAVEFHGDIALFVVAHKRGTLGLLGEFMGLGTSDSAGVIQLIGARDGAFAGFADQISESFIWAPDQVPGDPTELFEAEALDDFGNPFPGYEGWTVRDYILAQLSELRGFPVHAGSDISVCLRP